MPSSILAAVKSSRAGAVRALAAPGSHVNSVGTARRDQREIDAETFERSARIIVDTQAKACSARPAMRSRRSERIRLQDVHELAKLVTGEVPGRRGDARDHTVQVGRHRACRTSRSRR